MQTAIHSFVNDVKKSNALNTQLEHYSIFGIYLQAASSEVY
jgi:hypothetical protein